MRTTHARLATTVAAALLALAGLSATSTALAGDGMASASGVHWQDVGSEADVEAAFKRAKAEKKPVLLYWGAVWCPPCNQLKATLFNRQDFIARTRDVVAVHLDGDIPAAQKLGTRFKVRGYPTMILFTPGGAEITRLPGEADAAQVLQALQLGLSSGRPVRQVLADAQAGKPLSKADWQGLAFYSWDTDESALVPAAQRGAVLQKLAKACPATAGEAQTRLLLKGLAEGADEAKPGAAEAPLRARLLALLADPAASRAHMDVLTNTAGDLVRALSPAASPERTALLAAFDSTLRRLQADIGLSRADRLQALYSRVDLALLDAPKGAKPALPAALLDEVRDAAKRADTEISDRYERQAVVTAAGSLLSEAGLYTDADTLLQGSLAKSHSPYYLMSELASNARKDGRPADALTWSRQAWDKSEGPATRLQWGASYISALIDLAPADDARIEQAAAAVFDEAVPQPAAFYERSARSLKKIASGLTSWNKDGSHAAALGRLKTRLDGLCAQVPTADQQRAACDALLPHNSPGASTKS